MHNNRCVLKKNEKVIGLVTWRSFVNIAIGVQLAFQFVAYVTSLVCDTFVSLEAICSDIYKYIKNTRVKSFA